MLLSTPCLALNLKLNRPCQGLGSVIGSKMSKCRFAAPSTSQAALRCPWKGLSAIGQSGPSKFLDTWSKRAGPLHSAAGCRTKSRRINLACDPSPLPPRHHGATLQADSFLVSPCGQLARSPWTKDHNRYHTFFFYHVRPTWLPGEFGRFCSTPCTSWRTDRNRPRRRRQPAAALETRHNPDDDNTPHHTPLPPTSLPSQTHPPATSQPLCSPSQLQPSVPARNPKLTRPPSFSLLPRFTSSTLHQRDSRSDLFKGYTGTGGGVASRTVSASPSRQFHQPQHQQQPYPQQTPPPLQQQQQAQFGGGGGNSAYAYGGSGGGSGSGSHLGVAENRGGYRPATPSRRYVMCPAGRRLVLFSLVWGWMDGAVSGGTKEGLTVVVCLQGPVQRCGAQRAREPERPACGGDFGEG